MGVEKRLPSIKVCRETVPVVNDQNHLEIAKLNKDIVIKMANSLKTRYIAASDSE
jgi:hypothetical protein